jgi:WD40 repeat protein
MTIKFLKNGSKFAIICQTEDGKTSIDIYRILPEGLYERIHTYTIVGKITCFDVNDDGSVLAIGFESGEVQIWNISPDETEIHLADTRKDHTMIVNCIKFHPTKPLFLTGSKDGTARLYQLCEKNLATCIRIIRPHHKTIPEITSLGFSDDGSMIIVGDSKNTVSFQEIENSGTHYTSSFPQHSGRITRVRVCHNGDLAVASGSNLTIWEKYTVGYGRESQKICGMHYVNAFVCHKVLQIICVSDSLGGRVNIYACSPSSSYYELTMFFDNCYAEDVLFHPTEPILGIYMKSLKKIHFYRISDDYATIAHIFTITL